MQEALLLHLQRARTASSSASRATGVVRARRCAKLGADGRRSVGARRRLARAECGSETGRRPLQRSCSALGWSERGRPSRERESSVLSHDDLYSKIDKFAFRNRRQ